MKIKAYTVNASSPLLGRIVYGHDDSTINIVVVIIIIIIIPSGTFPKPCT